MFRAVILFVLLQTIAISWASVTVPYIKPMLLGRTFDYSKSIVGNDIYPADVWKHPLQTNHYETKVKYRVVRSAKERRDVLDISGHLSVQVMSGVVDFKGSGEYLKESFDAGNNVEVVAKISFLTVTRSITDDKRPNPAWDKKPNIIGQHYVRSITYGGNLIASLKFTAKSEKDKKKLAIKVEAKVSGKKFGVGVGGQFKQLAESVKDISTLTISYKATAPLVTVPTDIDSLVKAIEDFPTSVKSIDGGIGVPIEAELVELSHLSPSPQLKFLIDGSIQTRIASIETMYFDLRTTIASIRSLLKRHPVLKRKDELAIGRFYGRIFNVTETFNEVISKLDLNVYTRQSHQFRKAFNAYRGGSILLPDKYMREYKALEVSIEPPVVTPTNHSGELIAFHASLGSVRTAVRGDVVFDNIDFNIGDAYNNATGVFTAPKNGIYQFMASVLPQSSRSSRSREAVTFDIRKNGRTYTRVQSNPIAKSTQVSKTVLIRLNKGETVILRIVLGGARGTGRYTTFGGYLVRAL